MIVLLLFLVQLFVSLYRYNMKMAAFHDSRADVLLLISDTSALTFEQLARITFSDELDFSKLERPPTEYAVDLAKQLISRADQTKTR